MFVTLLEGIVLVGTRDTKHISMGFGGKFGAVLACVSPAPELQIAGSRKELSVLLGGVLRSTSHAIHAVAL